MQHIHRITKRHFEYKVQIIMRGTDDDDDEQQSFSLEMEINEMLGKK